MYRYVVLDLLVCMLTGLLVLIRPVRAHSPKRIIALCLVLCLLTAVFDSLLIALHIINYNPSHLLGIHIWKAPIEDFAYPVVAAVIVPYLWRRSDNA